MSTTDIRATVPRLATTGKITLARASRPTIDSPADFTVDSYRNTAGFSFRNYKPHITFDQMTATFGRDQTYDSIDFCFPFGCTFSFRDPFAMILNAIANTAFGGDTGGACFGFGLATQRILAGQRSLGDFSPPGVQTIWALYAPNKSGGPSGPLTEYINSQQVAQLSTEVLGHYFAQSMLQLSMNTGDLLNLIRGKIRDALVGGAHPLILINNGSSSGKRQNDIYHVVVAYDLEDVDPNHFFIYVYDPNNEFLNSKQGQGANEDTDGDTHRTAVTTSRIEVTNDTWKLLDFNDGLFILNGSIADIIVTVENDIPMQLSMPGPASPLILFTTAAGSVSRTTQLADRAGHLLFGPSGKLNSDPATRLQATPFVPFMGSTAAVEAFLVAPKTGMIVQSVLGIAAIPDHHTLIGSDFVARVDSEATVGVSDQISFDPKGGVAFQTKAARKPLTASVLTRTKGLVQSAELTTTSLREGVDEFRLDEARSDVIFHHTGPAVSFRLRLSSRGASMATFDSGPLQIGAGETATFSPANWDHLDAVPMTVREPGGEERRTILQNYLITTPLGRIVALNVEQQQQQQQHDAEEELEPREMEQEQHDGNGRPQPKVANRPRARVIEVISSFDPLPSDSQIAIAWTVRQAGRIVAHETRTVRDVELRPGLRRDQFIFNAPAAGDYTVRADLVIITTEGVIQAARTSTSSASLVIR